jgi:anti-anti-sigma regulatory factor
VGIIIILFIRWIDVQPGIESRAVHANSKLNGWGMASSTEPRWSLQLPPDCSIASIRSVYALVIEAFRRQDKLEIDCSNVDKADVTSIQVLISAAKTANRQGHPIVLTAISQTLRSTFQRAGFSSDTMADHHLHQKNGGT